MEREFLVKAEESGINKVYSKPLQIKMLADLLLQTGFIQSIPSALNLK